MTIVVTETVSPDQPVLFVGHRVSRRASEGGDPGMDEIKPATAVLPPLPADDGPRTDLAELASITARLAEKFFAARFDRQLVAGAAPDPGSPLAVHVARLAS